jgi:hypothetical protein
MRKNHIESRRRGISQTRQKKKGRKANWIDYSWHRNCLLKHVIEEEVVMGIEVTGRQGRRYKQLLYDLEEGKVY